MNQDLRRSDTRSSLLSQFVILLFFPFNTYASMQSRYVCWMLSFDCALRWSICLHSPLLHSDINNLLAIDHFLLTGWLIQGLENDSLPCLFTYISKIWRLKWNRFRQKWYYAWSSKKNVQKQKEMYVPALISFKRFVKRVHLKNELFKIFILCNNNSQPYYCYSLEFQQFYSYIVHNTS